MFDTVKKILIIKPSALGDIVHSLPFLASVKKKFPLAEIDWVVAHGLHTFLEGHPMINQLWVIKKDQWKKPGHLARTLKEINALRKGLKASGYDVSIDLSGLLRSGIITYLAGAKIKLGFKASDEGSPFFYTHKIHGSMNIHAIDRYMEIAGFMGCDTDTIDYPLAPYDPTPPILRELPPQYGVMSPSAGKPANRWPAEKFGRLASKLTLPTVVIANAAEAGIAEQVVGHAKGNAISVAGRTSLKDLLALIAGASFFVCNDTGPMHIAAALNIPVFAIFGPANPVRTGPYGSIHTVIQKKMDCAPCYAKQPCSHFRCMNELSVQAVFDILDQKVRQT
ncbi:glycosyltransferase family 9 protein [Desulfobacula sp.]|uniref:glycosyltransferase family 9 protein n=1 Tax=Desulfobacula sp. TaxID=2593537 RepID=UPI00260853F8|nr:glycosyltransferase family 9 protein [Desulfobacula sp.]